MRFLLLFQSFFLPERVFWRLSLTAVLILVLGTTITWWIDPARAYELRRENAFFEDLSVILYLIAVVVAIFFIRMRRPKALYLMIPTLSLFFAFEELDWIGQLTQPPVIHGVKIDALHDFVEVLYLWLRIPEWPTVVFVISVTTLACAVLVLFYGAIDFLMEHKPLFLAGGGLFIILTGQLVDVMEDTTRFQRYFFEALPENIGALLFLVAATAIGYHRQTTT